MSFECCNCKKIVDGTNRYAVPEGYPSNPVHDGKPLCDGCGGSPEPTLDAICEKLDVELLWKFLDAVCSVLDADQIRVLTERVPGRFTDDDGRPK